MRITPILIPALLAIAALAACGSTAPEPAAADAPAKISFIDSDKGPKIGDVVPMDMALTTIDGASTSLAKFAGTKGIVVAFNRSADWCPFCQAQMKGLSDISTDVKATGYNLVTITYDDPAVLKKFTTNQKISYPLLSDKGSKLIDALKLRDSQYIDGPAVGVPYASIFIIGADGKVKARAVSSDYKIRPTNKEVMSLLKVAG